MKLIKSYKQCKHQASMNWERTKEQANQQISEIIILNQGINSSNTKPEPQASSWDDTNDIDKSKAFIYLYLFSFMYLFLLIYLEMTLTPVLRKTLPGQKPSVWNFKSSKWCRSNSILNSNWIATGPGRYREKFWPRQCFSEHWNCHHHATRDQLKSENEI